MLSCHFRPRLESLEERTVPAHVPLLVLPGIAGSLPRNLNNTSFLLERGVPPNQIVLDPIFKTYDPLINTLQGAGYKLGVDLFPAPYDWRMPNAPTDTSRDGVISGISAQSITDSNFAYGVDYLGYWLKAASRAWTQQHPGQELKQVDVIAHSMGNLVALSYIDSPAYGGSYVAANGKVTHLPTIRNYFMVSAPVLGASTPWNLANDNAIFNFFDETIASVLHSVYEKVLSGTTIAGPTPITKATITSAFTGQPDPILFLNQYVPTLAQLIATYDFLNIGTDADPVFTNVNSQEPHSELLLDLNGGRNPNAFADRVQNLSVIFGTNVSTATTATRMVGTGGQIYSIADDHPPRPTVAGEVWFQDNVVQASGATPVGDGTVPFQSLRPDRFLGDPAIHLFPFTQGVNTKAPVTHGGILSNPDFLRLVVGKLQASQQATPPHLTRILTNGQPLAPRPVHVITLVFDQDVSFRPGAFVLLGPDGRPIGLRVGTFVANGRRVVNLKFLSGGQPLDTLPPGRYKLRIVGPKVQNNLGLFLSPGLLDFGFAST